MAEPGARKKVTIPMLMDKKKKREPIVQLAVYDYETAIVADRVGMRVASLGRTLDFYNCNRPHSSLDGCQPARAYFGNIMPLAQAA